MANLVKIQSGVLVNPNHVASVVCDHERNCVRVSLVTGEISVVPPEYREGVWATFDRLKTLLGGGV